MVIGYIYTKDLEKLKLPERYDYASELLTDESAYTELHFYDEFEDIEKLLTDFVIENSISIYVCETNFLPDDWYEISNLDEDHALERLFYKLQIFGYVLKTIRYMPLDLAPNLITHLQAYFDMMSAIRKPKVEFQGGL